MIERVLHVIEPGVMGRTALALVGDVCRWRELGITGVRAEHIAVVLGGDACADRAAWCGVPRGERIGLPGGWAVAAGTALSRLLARMLERGARPDVVVAWSAASMAVMQVATRGVGRGGSRGALGNDGPWRTAAVMDAPPRLRGSAPARAATRVLMSRAARSATLLTTSEHARGAWTRAMAMAATASRLPLGLRTERAEVDVSHAERRRALREAWGADDRTTVVLAAGEPEWQIDAHAFSYHCGVTGVAGVHVLGVTPSGAAQVERGLRFCERHGGAWRMAIDDRPMWELLAGCDAVYWASPARGAPAGVALAGEPALTSGLRWAAAAGLPIVAADHAATREAIGKYAGATLVPLTPTRLFTKALLDVLGPSAGGGARFQPQPTLDVGGWAREFESRLAGRAATNVG